MDLFRDTLQELYQEASQKGLIIYEVNWENDWWGNWIGHKDGCPFCGEIYYQSWTIYNGWVLRSRRSLRALKRPNRINDLNRHWYNANVIKWQEMVG